MPTLTGEQRAEIARDLRPLLHAYAISSAATVVAVVVLIVTPAPRPDWIAWPAVILIYASVMSLACWAVAGFVAGVAWCVWWLLRRTRAHRVTGTSGQDS